MATVDTAPPLAASPELLEDLLALRDLLERGHIERARSFVKELVVRWPDSERVKRFAYVLEPPVARVVPGRRGRNMDREIAWLREHAGEYSGCWIAVYGEELIAADRQLAAVMAKLDESPVGEDALLHYQAEPMIIR